MCRRTGRSALAVINVPTALLSQRNAMRHFSRDLSCLGDDEPIHNNPHPLSNDHVNKHNSDQMDASKNTHPSSRNFDSHKTLAIHPDVPESAHYICHNLDSKCAAEGSRKKNVTPLKNASYLNREFDLWCTAEDGPRTSFGVDRNDAALKSVNFLNRRFDLKAADDSRKKCGVVLKNSLATKCADEQQKKCDAMPSRLQRDGSLNHSLPAKRADKPEHKCEGVIPRDNSLASNPHSSLPENGSYLQNIHNYLMPCRNHNLPVKCTVPKYVMLPTITNLINDDALNDSVKYSDAVRRFDDPSGSVESEHNSNRYKLTVSDSEFKSLLQCADGFKSSTKLSERICIQNDDVEKELEKLNDVYSDAFLNELKRRYYEPLPPHSQAQDDCDELSI